MEVNHLGWFVHEVVRQVGVVVYGEDLKYDFPAPSDDALRREISDFVVNARQHYDSPRAWIDGLFTAARMLVWLKEGRLSSKTGAAEWAAQKVNGSWKADMMWVRDLRLHPGALAQAANGAALERLRPALVAACDELEAALVPS
jgi:hypothetical protein